MFWEISLFTHKLSLLSLNTDEQDSKVNMSRPSSLPTDLSTTSSDSLSSSAPTNVSCLNVLMKAYAADSAECHLNHPNQMTLNKAQQLHHLSASNNMNKPYGMMAAMAGSTTQGTPKVAPRPVRIQRRSGVRREIIGDMDDFLLYQEPQS